MSGRAAPSGRRRHGAAATRDRERRSLRSARARFRQRHKAHGGAAPCACASAPQRHSPPIPAAPVPAAPNKSQGQVVRMRLAAAVVPGAVVVLSLLKGPRMPAPPTPRAARGSRRLRHLIVPRALHLGPGRACAAPRTLGCEELLPALSVSSDREPPVPLRQPGCGSSVTASAGSAGRWCPARPCPALRHRCCRASLLWGGAVFCSNSLSSWCEPRHSMQGAFWME